MSESNLIHVRAVPASRRPARCQHSKGQFWPCEAKIGLLSGGTAQPPAAAQKVRGRYLWLGGSRGDLDGGVGGSVGSAEPS